MAPGTGGILALDLSSKRTGWAYGTSPATRISGAWRMSAPGPTYGETYNAIGNAVCDAIDLHKPRMIVCEAPYISIATIGAAEVLFGMWAIVQNIAYLHDIRCEKRPVVTPRAAVIGTCRFPKGQAKKHVQQWLREGGYHYHTDDEADALLLLLYELGVRAQKPEKGRKAA